MKWCRGLGVPALSLLLLASVGAFCSLGDFTSGQDASHDALLVFTATSLNTSNGKTLPIPGAGAGRSVVFHRTAWPAAPDERQYRN